MFFKFNKHIIDFEFDMYRMKPKKIRKMVNQDNKKPILVHQEVKKRPQTLLNNKSQGALLIYSEGYKDNLLDLLK